MLSFSLPWPPVRGRGAGGLRALTGVTGISTFICRGVLLGAGRPEFLLSAVAQKWTGTSYYTVLCTVTWTPRWRGTCFVILGKSLYILKWFRPQVAYCVPASGTKSNQTWFFVWCLQIKWATESWLWDDLLFILKPGYNTIRCTLQDSELKRLSLPLHYPSDVTKHQAYSAISSEYKTQSSSGWYTCSSSFIHLWAKFW